MMVDGAKFQFQSKKINSNHLLLYDPHFPVRFTHETIVRLHKRKTAIYFGAAELSLYNSVILRPINPQLSQQSAMGLGQNFK